jgi:hypothetical protein
VTFSKPDDAASPKQSDISYVWIAGILAVIASAPALFAREIFSDDWTVYYVYWTEGAASVARLMWQAAHGGYSIPMEIFVALGQNTPELAARIIGLGSNLLGAFLLYRILSTSRHTRAIASLLSSLFLLSPFYVIRFTQNAGYDFFLVFYFLSYVLMNAQSRLPRRIAPFCLFFSLSLETLIALEPLRLLVAWRTGERWTTWLARLVPFWLAIAAIIVLRLTIMGKSGHYLGQYSPVHDAKITLSALRMHLHAFPRALSFAVEYAFALFGNTITVILILLTATAFVLLGTTAFRTEGLSRSHTSRRNALLLFSVGAAVAVIGGLPYALVGIYGDVTRGESRLLFPSQFGFLLVIATAILCVPAARIRAAIAGGVIVLFALSTAHDSKWLLYDGLVTTDLARQARAALLANPQPKLVELTITPPSHTLLFRNRCLSASDMNATQMILRDERNQRSFIYTDNCGDFTNPNIVPHGICPVSYLDGYPCPQHREKWLYRAAPGIPALDDIGIVELLSAVMRRSPSATEGRGELVNVTDGRPSPLARAEYKPPCSRPGVRALLWLLAMPARSCDATPAAS